MKYTAIYGIETDYSMRIASFKPYGEQSKEKN
jgi:hypothetical protein